MIAGARWIDCKGMKATLLKNKCGGKYNRAAWLTITEVGSSLQNSAHRNVQTDGQLNNNNKKTSRWYHTNKVSSLMAQAFLSLSVFYHLQGNGK